MMVMTFGYAISDSDYAAIRAYVNNKYALSL
jgi:hypothetical protein